MEGLPDVIFVGTEKGKKAIDDNKDEDADTPVVNIDFTKKYVEEYDINKFDELRAKSKKADPSQLGLLFHEAKYISSSQKLYSPVTNAEP